MRIITSKSCSLNLEKIHSKFPFKNKAQILRIAIAISLKYEKKYNENVSYTKDGFEINSETLFGGHLDLFNAILKIYYNELLSDDDNYVNVLTHHIETGIEILINEMNYHNDDLDFIKFIIEGSV